MNSLSASIASNIAAMCTTRSRSMGRRFAVAGHDRGARVALRLALDHPNTVSHLAVLDIVPTKTIYETIDQQHATTVWRYFFLIQPPDLPERLIASDPHVPVLDTQ
jgi:haloacetate dehalogenase